MGGSEDSVIQASQRPLFRPTTATFKTSIYSVLGGGVYWDLESHSIYSSTALCSAYVSPFMAY